MLRRVQFVIDVNVSLTSSKDEHLVLRLKKRVQFLNVAAQGKKIPVSGLVLQFSYRGDTNPGRVGFTVTKKVGNAVIRNRIKRRLRSVVQDVSKKISFDGIDMVIIGRQRTYTRTYQDLVNDFYYALSKVGVKSSK